MYWKCLSSHSPEPNMCSHMQHDFSIRIVSQSRCSDPLDHYHTCVSSNIQFQWFLVHAGKKIPARESFPLGNQFLHWRSIARVLAETLKTRWTTAFTVDYCGTQLHTVAHASKINPARESLPLGNPFLHWHSIARVLAQTLKTRWTTAFTVDYCGTQLHTVAHANKTIPAR